MSPRGNRKHMPQCSTGSLVRSYRLVAGQTQAKFAQRSGLSTSQLAAIERDQRRPSPGELEQIARTFSREFLKSISTAA